LGGRCFVRHTIMAVDDVLVNLMILESILEDEYNVITSTNGEEALKLMKDGTKPDLLLLDLSMPGMSGFELLEKMHEDESMTNIPAIFVTGETDQYSEEKGLKLGAVDYIKKPYVPTIISAKIRNHLEIKSLRDNLEEMVAVRTRELEERTQELVATHGAIIMGMSLLSESRDKVTGAHLARIKKLTLLLARRLYEMHPNLLNEEMVGIIATYSPLHDVGKVSVPDAVLNKSGKLTPEEFEQMKNHTIFGGDLLRQIAEFLPSGKSEMIIAIEIAENHHERYDGTGYPHEIKGEEIPLSARIVSVSDVYDALRSPRPYKQGFTHEEAMNIMLVGDGRTSPIHFDPLVLEAFRQIEDDLRHAYDSNPDPSVEILAE